MPRERSKPRHASSPFPKGTEGIACPQMWTSRRNTRSLSESPLKMAASSARGAKARGQGCHPQEGSQRARLFEHGTIVPREFWRAPQTERCPKRLFLSPSAFFEPAKKVRKNCNRIRPVAVSRDTAQQKNCARATRAASPSKRKWPAAVPLVSCRNRFFVPAPAPLSRRSSVIPRSRTSYRGHGPLSAPDVGPRPLSRGLARWAR